MKITMKSCKNNHQINIEHCLIKKYIKRGYGRNRYRNMSEENKQKLREYKSLWQFEKYIKKMN